MTGIQPEHKERQLKAIEIGLATAPDIQKDLRKYISRIIEPYDKVGLDDSIFEFAELVGYRINNNRLDIAEDLDLEERYGLINNQPRTSVGRAFRGYDGEHFPDHEFEGLFGKGVHGTKINDIIEGIRYEKGGQATIETHGDQMRNGGLIGGRKGGLIGGRATVETHGDQMRNGGLIGGLIGGRKVADMINPETGVRYVVEASRKGNEARGFHIWSLEEIANIGELKYGEGLTWNDTTSNMNEKYDKNWSTNQVKKAYQNNKHRITDEEE